MEDEGVTPAPPRVVVTLPPALLSLFPGAPRRMELRASTVRDVIDALDGGWPGMRDRICDSTPRIRRRVNVFVAGERATLETRLTHGVEVAILTAVIG